MYQKYFKRGLDIVLATVGFVASAPVFLVISLSLFFLNKGKPFFYQNRPGLKEKPFEVMKFKTMTDETDDDGTLLPNHLRVTPFGAFLRRSSLDEIPQLINVMKGEMSLIGPRPLLKKYVPLYSAEQRRRHLVRPGVTGWAQVNGRNAISWKEKFELDVYYVDNIGFLMDMKILFKTLLKVIKAEDVNATTDVTMSPFEGGDS